MASFEFQHTSMKHALIIGRDDTYPTGPLTDTNSTVLGFVRRTSLFSTTGIKHLPQQGNPLELHYTIFSTGPP